MVSNASGSRCTNVSAQPNAQAVVLNKMGRVCVQTQSQMHQWLQLMQWATALPSIFIGKHWQMELTGLCTLCLLPLCYRWHLCKFRTQYLDIWRRSTSLYLKLSPSFELASELQLPAYLLTIAWLRFFFMLTSFFTTNYFIRFDTYIMNPLTRLFGT